MSGLLWHAAKATWPTARHSTAGDLYETGACRMPTCTAGVRNRALQA